VVFFFFSPICLCVESCLIKWLFIYFLNFQLLLFSFFQSAQTNCHLVWKWHWGCYQTKVLLPQITKIIWYSLANILPMADNCHCISSSKPNILFYVSPNVISYHLPAIYWNYLMRYSNHNQSKHVSIIICTMHYRYLINVNCICSETCLICDQTKLV